MTPADEIESIARRNILEMLAEVPFGPDRVRVLAVAARLIALAISDTQGAPIALQFCDMLAAEVRKRGH